MLQMGLFLLTEKREIIVDKKKKEYVYTFVFVITRRLLSKRILEIGITFTLILDNENR